jgi:hypothetical protein
MLREGRKIKRVGGRGRRCAAFHRRRRARGESGLVLRLDKVRDVEAKARSGSPRVVVGPVGRAAAHCFIGHFGGDGRREGPGGEPQDSPQDTSLFSLPPPSLTLSLSLSL